MSHESILEGLKEARAAIAEFNASASRGPEHSALGVDFTDRQARRLIERQFPHCRGAHIKAKVLGRPANSAVAAAQGYKFLDTYLEERAKK